jgi:hypothetical protein
MRSIKTLLLVVFVLNLSACAAFQSGGALNPLRVRLNSSITVKAGSDTSLRVFMGSIPNLGLDPAEFYRQNSSQVPFSGNSSTFAYLGIAQLTNLFLPPGWNFGIGGDGVEVIANSSSVIAFDGTINTVTRVEVGEYSINTSLSVPKDTALGVYPLQARVSVRGASPVLIQWAVNVTAR